MDTLAPAALLRALPAYDVGWAAFNTGLNAAHLDTALPNKAFEYLASGLPVAAGPHRALRRLVEDEGVGFVVADPRATSAAMLARTDLDAPARPASPSAGTASPSRGTSASWSPSTGEVADGSRGGTGRAPARLHSGG